MKESRRPHGRPDRRGHALARHLPFDRGKNPAPACRAGRPQVGFHDPGHRRPSPPDQAAHRGREYRREALAGAGLRRDARRLEEPRAHAANVPPGEAASFAGGRGLNLYSAFQERLKILNAADFGDLLLETIRLFREHPEVLREYQRRFKYILVDEYQDTNVAQYLWLRLLAQPTSPRVRGEVDPPERSEGEAGFLTLSRPVFGAVPVSRTAYAGVMARWSPVG